MFAHIAIFLSATIVISRAAIIKHSPIDFEKTRELEYLEKRGPFKNLFCISGNFDGGQAYCRGNEECTQSTNSFFVHLNLESNESSAFKKDEAYRKIQAKLQKIMTEMRAVQADLMDGNEFNDLSTVDQIKLLCRARNTFNLLKLQVENIPDTEWVHFFDMARREDVKGLDCFQTNIYQLFEHVKDLIEHYARKYRIFGIQLDV